jgi:hypothetical protein
MSQFTEANIIRSLVKWFSETYAGGPAETGVARTLDEDTADSWVDFNAPSVVQTADRIAGKRTYTVQVTVNCYGKSSTNLYAALGAAESVAELLRNEIVPVLSFNEDDTPVIGYVRLEEPRLADDTHQQGDIPMDVRIISAAGTAQEE